MMGPHAVHQHARRERVVAIDDVASQIQTAAAGAVERPWAVGRQCAEELPWHAAAGPRRVAADEDPRFARDRQLDERMSAGRDLRVLAR